LKSVKSLANLKSNLAAILLPMSNRFFIAAVDGERAVLERGEAHHLAQVMRAQIGTEVVLFDGSGCEYAARVTRMGRSEVHLQIHERRETDRELDKRITLAVALPKGDRQRWLVEKAVELGVAGLVPIHTRRGVAQPAERALRRLERAVIAASKQCGRNRLMEIGAASTLEEYVASASPDSARLIADPSGEEVSLPFPGDRPVAAETRDYQLLIGPEGGFTSDELELARGQGWRTINLGPRILRVETAALALVTLVAFHDHEFV
jgi:16S rRNA (uracil1498-N3)-methyltransferase